MLRVCFVAISRAEGAERFLVFSRYLDTAADEVMEVIHKTRLFPVAEKAVYIFGSAVSAHKLNDKDSQIEHKGDDLWQKNQPP